MPLYVKKITPLGKTNKYKGCKTLSHKKKTLTPLSNIKVDFIVFFTPVDC